MLQAMYPVPESLSDLSQNVQDAYETYRTRAYMRSQIKFTFALSLSLVLALGLFAAAWAAVFTARRLVQPISDIAEGTRAVAEGDYDKQLPMPKSEDEIGFLVSSFNAMTRRIARARNALEDSRRELLVQHNYLETVLAGLSTGVMALDGKGNILTANPAADQIIGCRSVSSRASRWRCSASATRRCGRSSSGSTRAENGARVGRTEILYVVPVARYCCAGIRRWTTRPTVSADTCWCSTTSPSWSRRSVMRPGASRAAPAARSRIR